MPAGLPPWLPSEIFTAERRVLPLLRTESSAQPALATASDPEQMAAVVSAMAAAAEGPRRAFPARLRHPPFSRWVLRQHPPVSRLYPSHLFSTPVKLVS